MSNELEKIISTDLSELPEATAAAYTGLHAKITNQGVTFGECATAWHPARIKLVHPTTSDDAKPEEARTGDLYYAGGLIKRPMRFVVAYAYPSRVRFVADVDRRPSCSSENVDLVNYRDKDTSMSVYGDSCANCPHDDQPFRHGQPTSCNNVMNVLIIPENLEDIFVYAFSKSSWSIGRKLVDQAMANTPPWGRFFELDSKEEKRQGGSGKYALPVVRGVSVADNPVPDHLVAFAEFVYTHFNEYRKGIRETVMEKAKDIEEAIDVDSLKDTSAGSFADKM